MQELSPPKIISVGFDVAGGRLADRFLFLRKQLDLELLDDGVGDFVLDGKDIGQVPIIAIGPDMAAVLAVDELAGDADACSSFSHASFQNEIYVKMLGHFLHIDVFALVSERSVARD